MDKEQFIQLLQRNDPQEILDHIKKNGKKPKGVSPFTLLDDVTKETSNNSLIDQ